MQTLEAETLAIKRDLDSLFDQPLDLDEAKGNLGCLFGSAYSTGSNDGAAFRFSRRMNGCLLFNRI
jgi:hypothetical protein